MKRIRPLTFVLGVAAIACCFVWSGCIYEVPITSEPTRKVDQRLLGDWTSTDGKHRLKVVMLDDANYIVCKGHKREGACFDHHLYRVYHSDTAGAAFVSVGILDREAGKPRYAYYGWELSDDGRALVLRLVNDRLVPTDTKDSASVRNLLKENLRNPALFVSEDQFTKDKP